MKKKTECKLMNITSADQITYEDYQLYNSVLNVEKHPILSYFVFGLIALPFLAITIASCFFLPKAMVSIFLGGLVSSALLGGGLYLGLKELNESKDILNQYKLLKKSKKLENLKALMEEYTASERFKQEKQTSVINSLKDMQTSIEQAKTKATKAYETTQTEIGEQLTLIQKLIARLEAGASPEEVLNEETKESIARKNYSLKTMTEYLENYNAGHAQTKNDEPKEAHDNTENLTGVGF